MHGIGAAPIPKKVRPFSFFFFRLQEQLMAYFDFSLWDSTGDVTHAHCVGTQQCPQLLCFRGLRNNPVLLAHFGEMRRRELKGIAQQHIPNHWARANDPSLPVMWWWYSPILSWQRYHRPEQASSLHLSFHQKERGAGGTMECAQRACPRFPVCFPIMGSLEEKNVTFLTFHSPALHGSPMADA